MGRVTAPHTSWALSGDGSGRGAAAAVTAAHQRIGEMEDRSMFGFESKIDYQLLKSDGNPRAGGRCVGVG